jgi:hypothetical protein
MEDNGEKLKELKPSMQLTPNAKGALAAGGGIVALDVLTHAGPAGLLVAGIGTWVMARHTSDFLYMKDRLTSHFIHSPETAEQGPSFADRLLGRGQPEESAPASLPQERKASLLKRLVATQSSGDIDLAPGLQLGINDIAGKATFICGIRRSGKTTLGVRLAEEMGKFNMAMLIPDLKGDWLSCIDTLPNAVILRQGEATEKNAASHGYAICEEGLQLILDVASYDDMNEAALVIAGMIAGLFLWEKKHPDARRLCAVFLDEAQSYLPQDVKDSIISEPVARDAMMNAYMQVLAVGGSLGLFPVILTQRISQVAKKIVAQSELAFLLKQTMDLDINRYQSFTTVQKEKIRALKQGQGIYVDIEGASSIHQFHKRTSSDSMSRTPSVNVPQKSKQPIEDYDDLPDLWEDDEDDDPLPVVQSKRTAPPKPSKYDRAVKAWNAGNRSIRRLADAMELNFNQARDLINDMHNKGIINKHER